MTTAQRATVKQVIAAHQKEVADLGIDEATAFMPVLDKAQAELATQLKRWVAKHPDGEYRWTPHSYRNALVQIAHSQRTIHEKMRDRLEEGGDTASLLGAQHLVDDVARFSGLFEGSVQKLSVKPASLMASGQAYRVRRFETSSARYAGRVGKDIQQRLAIDILKGSKVQETIKRLQESGGPSGLVSLGNRVEDIPEGLFARYRFWAERLVRTEFSSAYCTTSAIGRQEAGRSVHGLQKKWMADAVACPMCLEQDGDVVEESDVFSPTGASDPPCHPFCGCSVVPWKSDWGDLLGDIAPVFRT